MARLNKSDLVDILFIDGGLLRKDAQVAVDLIFETIAKTLVAGNDVSITHFGSLRPILKKARIGTDPHTHTQFMIPETRTISFSPASSLKLRLNS